MKKIIIIIAAILMLLTGVIFREQVRDYIRTELMSTCYYGCPNSRRVKKLNLKKSVRIV